MKRKQLRFFFSFCHLYRVKKNLNILWDYSFQWSLSCSICSKWQSGKMWNWNEAVGEIWAEIWIIRTCHTQPQAKSSTHTRIVSHLIVSSQMINWSMWFAFLEINKLPNKFNDLTTQVYGIETSMKSHLQQMGPKSLKCFK